MLPNKSRYKTPPAPKPCCGTRPRAGLCLLDPSVALLCSSPSHSCTLMGTSPCRDMAGGVQTSSPWCPVPSSAWRCMVGIDLSFQHSVTTSSLLFGGCSCIPVGVSITPQDLSAVSLWCVSWHHRTPTLRRPCTRVPDMSVPYGTRSQPHCGHPHGLHTISPF